MNGQTLTARTSLYLSSTLSHLTRSPLGSVVVDDAELCARSNALLDQVIDAFSVTDGVLHLEAFNLPDRLVFNEVACRAGGGGIVAMMQAVTGYNLFEAMVRMSLGEPPTSTYEVSAKTAGFLLMYGDPGVLEQLDDRGLPAEWIVERKVAVPVGGRYTPVGRAGGSLVSYVVRGDNQQQVTERLRHIQETVSIRMGTV
jgi:hypothetical protein